MSKKKKLGIIGIVILLLLYLVAGIKYTILYKYGLLFLTIFNGASFFSYIFKKKNDQTLAPSLILIMVILYLFGLIGQLKIGVYVILILYNVLGLGTFANILINKKFDNFRETFFSVGMIVYAALFVVLAKTTFNRMFSIWDEFTYWSTASKNMYYLDDFVTNPNSTIIGIIYPPFPTMLQYFFCNVLGMYSQGIEIFTTIMLGFSMLLCVFKKFKRGNFVKTASIIFVICAIPAIFCDQLFYYSIYGDPILGIIIGYILFEYFTLENDKFKPFVLIMASICLSMTKPTGIVILLIITASLFLYYLVNKIIEAKKSKEKFTKNFFKNKALYIIIAMLLVGFVFFASWQLYVKFTVPEERFGKSDLVTYEGNPIKYVIKVFVKAAIGSVEGSDVMVEDLNSLGTAPEHFFDKKYYSPAPFAMSAGTWIAISLIGFIYIYRTIKDDEEKNKFKIYSICICISELLYMLFLQVAYMIMFSGGEAAVHNSLQRYVGSYLMAIVMFIVFMYINYMNTEKIKESKLKYAIVSIIILIFTPVSPLFDTTLNAEVYNKRQISAVQNFLDIQKDVEEKVEKDETIFILHQQFNLNDNGWRLKYFLTPIRTSQVKRVDGTDGFDKESKELKEEIYQYDYVYFIENDDYFTSNYSSMFENYDIKEWTLYKIDKTNGVNGIKLIPVNMEE